MPQFAIFARNVGNLGRASGKRSAMSEVVARINQSLGDVALAATVSAYYAHTGNFVLVAPAEEAEKALQVVSAQLDRRCAIISAIELEMLARRIPKRKHPADSSTRWTPGLAVLVDGPVDISGLRSTPNADMTPLSPSVVAIYKRDILSAAGTLDKNRRLGGWGAITSVIQSQVQGLWTARSLSTVLGLLSRAMPA